jgi:hypothetical protein
MTEKKELELTGAVLVSNASGCEATIRQMVSRCKCGSIEYEGVKDCWDLMERCFAQAPAELIEVCFDCDFGYFVLGFFQQDLVLAWSDVDITRTQAARFIKDLYDKLEADAAFVGIGSWIASTREEVLLTIENKAGFEHWDRLEV